MEDLKPCPYPNCGSEDVEMIEDVESSVHCSDCRAYGPECDTPEEAAEKWNSITTETSIFVLTYGDDSNLSTCVVGTYSTLDLALKQTGMQFDTVGFYCKNWPYVVAETKVVDHNFYLIHKHTINKDYKARTSTSV